ncbi:ammonia monooxygenase [Mesorhizobium sp. M1A.F.Ca.IN.020.03.2.1]|uniref:DUF6527 family protein n=1 Tax=unclassified Mesorhizobium TaxID=325217 RepID=UPI000FD29402|nr:MULTISPECIES: DUF6527 family protein [unclassified Mesorhizobium]RUV07937.1 ammonia monooxygenase [Mesorhizobium sp. M1A.F.Ca.IN.020.03.2.1]RUV86935.1 ammonia monooxygenase [Mesorhizobium sp. M1A.F.Ca.IN.020.32.1.1]RWF81652.1 MAG: ammonia monooxygenase [Mesorhizobium sp.]RWG03003.1 MAG: ammonia monooxygenase [Mesorhizobium sp.]RWG91789.1 MAG: ammonia monooxygenase [Mesorhizobium sp.]
MAARGILRTVEGGRLMFWCPGCNEAHVVTVGEGPGPRWGFNGDYARPTFTPSVVVQSGHYVAGQEGKTCWCKYNAEQVAAGKEPAPFKCSVCHSFVTDGQIQFLADCTHALAGQTVELHAFDEK